MEETRGYTSGVSFRGIRVPHTRSVLVLKRFERRHSFTSMGLLPEDSSPLHPVTVDRTTEGTMD